MCARDCDKTQVCMINSQVNVRIRESVMEVCYVISHLSRFVGHTVLFIYSPCLSFNTLFFLSQRNLYDIINKTKLYC